MAEVVGAAEDKTREDFFLLNALQPQLQILPGTRVLRLHVVAQQAQHLHCVLQHTQKCGQSLNKRCGGILPTAADRSALSSRLQYIQSENEAQEKVNRSLGRWNKVTQRGPHPVWHHDQLLRFADASRLQLPEDNCPHVLLGKAANSELDWALFLESG